MSVLVVLVIISIAMALVALRFFTWSVRDGQLDDLATPPARLVAEGRLEGRPAAECRPSPAPGGIDAHERP